MSRWDRADVNGGEPENLFMASDIIHVRNNESGDVSDSMLEQYGVKSLRDDQRIHVLYISKDVFVNGRVKAEHIVRRLGRLYPSIFKPLPAVVPDGLESARVLYYLESEAARHAIQVDRERTPQQETRYLRRLCTSRQARATLVNTLALFPEKRSGLFRQAYISNNVGCFVWTSTGYGRSSDEKSGSDGGQVYSTSSSETSSYSTEESESETEESIPG